MHPIAKLKHVLWLGDLKAPLKNAAVKSIHNTSSKLQSEIFFKKHWFYLAFASRLNLGTTLFNGLVFLFETTVVCKLEQATQILVGFLKTFYIYIYIYTYLNQPFFAYSKFL